MEPEGRFCQGHRRWDGELNTHVNSSQIPTGLVHCLSCIWLPISTMIKVTHDSELLLSQCWPLEVKQGTFVPLLFLYLFLLTLQTFVFLSVVVVISAFHEHHPPRPELSQLSCPGGTNSLFSKTCFLCAINTVDQPLAKTRLSFHSSCAAFPRMHCLGLAPSERS